MSQVQQRERVYYISGKPEGVQHLWCPNHLGTQVIGFLLEAGKIRVIHFHHYESELKPWTITPERFRESNIMEAQTIILQMVQVGLCLVSRLKVAGSGVPAPNNIG